MHSGIGWKACATKTIIKGYEETWRGYKLHADVNDCGLPISVALTAASLHDSQAAIPLMKLTSERVDYLYDLMDAAYDAQPIYAVSRSLGHVLIIDKNGRGRRGGLPRERWAGPELHFLPCCC
ncbi:MAG: transposase [Deltaproteobacteria bacterium]|nr:transposase [Deltaproteobacteria bacterium]